MRYFFLGPFLAALPQRWRSSLIPQECIEWKLATILSGFGESLLALVAMVVWYSYSVTGWVSRALDAALAGKMPPDVNDQQIGFAAIMVFALHPLTWLIGYFGIEGSIRLVGAFTESYLGIFPLFLADKIYLRVTGRSAPSAAKAAGFEQGNFASYKQAIRERVRLARVPELPDELLITKQEEEEILEIRASQRKPDWTPPKTVRYQDVFYRLEATSEGAEPRPYRYRLRRLPAGVMGRTVLVYAPVEAPVLAKE
jgi:hypothetical protein